MDSAMLWSYSRIMRYMDSVSYTHLRHRIARQLCVPWHSDGYRGGPYHSGRRVHHLCTDV